MWNMQLRRSSEVSLDAFTTKVKQLIWGILTCCGRESKTGIVHNTITFQDRPMFSHIIKRSRQELSIDVAGDKGLSLKITQILTPVLFSDSKQVRLSDNRCFVLLCLSLAFFLLLSLTVSPPRSH